MTAAASPAPVVAVLEPGYADYGTERRILAPFGVTLRVVREGEAAADLLEAWDPRAILVRERAVDAQVLEACPSLEVVVRYGVGVDNVDLETARRRGVAVANVPDYGAEHEVSDHAVALYLAVARRLIRRDAAVRGGAWGDLQAEPVPGRRAATLGLVGFGRIGRRAAEKFRALGFARVLVFDPALGAEAARAAGVETVGLDSLCAEADLVSLHAPLTEATRHLVDARRLGLMKPTAILVNVARGGLVDEAALAEALGAGRLFGAGLDVYEVEPLPADSPLRGAGNVVLTDHAAWYSEAAVAALQQQAAEEVARVLAGDRPLNWVNPW